MKIQYPIVKPVQPPKNRYFKYVESALTRNWLTNNGPLHQELETRLAEYFGVENFMLVANGTLALHIAYKALEIKGEVATTPFSFAATASSLCWDNLHPNFVDIDEKSLNLDPIRLTESASAIVAVHVFGNPCDVDEISRFAELNNQKVIYDAAHTFGSQYKGKALLSYGDASTISFHATKIFHCIEGGGIVFKDKYVFDKAKQMINFGFDENNIPTSHGINAKMSEVHAAMGLSLLDMADDIVEHRSHLVAMYQRELKGVVCFQAWQDSSENNGAYMPVIFESEQQLLDVMAYLTEHGIQSRRYFYPSLSEIDVYGKQGQTPIANAISLKILCLPLYFDLSLKDVTHIATMVKRALLMSRQ